MQATEGLLSYQVKMVMHLKKSHSASNGTSKKKPANMTKLEQCRAFIKLFKIYVIMVTKNLKDRNKNSSKVIDDRAHSCISFHSSACPNKSSIRNCDDSVKKTCKAPVEDNLNVVEHVEDASEDHDSPEKYNAREGTEKVCNPVYSASCERLGVSEGNENVISQEEAKKIAIKPLNQIGNEEKEKSTLDNQRENVYEVTTPSKEEHHSTEVLAKMPYSQNLLEVQGESRDETLIPSKEEHQYNEFQARVISPQNMIKEHEVSRYYTTFSHKAEHLYAKAPAESTSQNDDEEAYMELPLDLCKSDLENKENIGEASKKHLNHCKVNCHFNKDGRGSEDCESRMWSSEVDDILFNRGFKVKRKVYTVYTMNGVFGQRPSAIGSIPWSWLSEEKWRLHTFARYPHNTVKSAIMLAQDGFAYIGSGQGTDDTVICVFCALTKRDWRVDEVISEVHRTLSSACPMVTGNRCMNIPMISPPNVSFGHELMETDSASPVESPVTGHGNFPQSGVSQAGVGEAQVQVSNMDTVSPSASARDNPNQVKGNQQEPSQKASAVPAPVPSMPSTQNQTATAPPASPPQTTSTDPAPERPSETTTTASTNPPQTAPNAAANTPTQRTPTFYELGIITERPKRYEYAVRAKRYETFIEWRVDHHIKKEDLADAGFYYAGYGDCARCFYCGGGLRNWEIDDDVWVEHARWFPKCAYMRQRMGQVFVDTVAQLARDHDKIPFQMVVEKMQVDPAAFQIESKETSLKNDAAVMTLKETGYLNRDILPVAASLKASGQILSSDEIYKEMVKKGAQRTPVEDSVWDDLQPSTDRKRDLEMLKNLKDRMNELRLLNQCKICMDKDVAVVFLTCGHMVCCTECASAMKDCPVCRKPVKATVRGFMA